MTARPDRRTETSTLAVGFLTLAASAAICAFGKESEDPHRLSAATADAARVFEGYEAFYASLGRSLFEAADARTLRKGTAPSGRYRLFWAGTFGADKRSHSVELADADLMIDGRDVAADNAVRFPGEVATALANRAHLYVNKDLVCVEGVAPSASGSAVRHNHVTLITHPYEAAARRYEFPSLFASCLGLYAGSGSNIRFYQATYRYADGQTAPSGVTFTEFTLESGEFRKTGAQVQTTFVEPDDVYRFRLQDTHRAGVPMAGSDADLKIGEVGAYSREARRRASPPTTADPRAHSPRPVRQTRIHARGATAPA